MDTENEQAQEVVEQEEETTEETEESTEEEQPEEDTVTLKKADFAKLSRKARAYDATKGEVKPIEKSEKKTDLSTKTENTSGDKLERMELRLEGYSKEEVDEIMDLGGTKVLDSKLVQGAIKALRAEKKSKDADANFPAKSPVYKKYTQEDLKSMSSAELAKILPHD